MADSVSVGDYPYSPNTTPIQPWPPQQTVWVYPPTMFPTVDYQLAAAKAYEAMEAYYKRLTEQLDGDSPSDRVTREPRASDLVAPLGAAGEAPSSPSCSSEEHDNTP